MRASRAVNLSSVDLFEALDRELRFFSEHRLQGRYATSSSLIMSLMAFSDRPEAANFLVDLLALDIEVSRAFFY